MKTILWTVTVVGIAALVLVGCAELRGGLPRNIRIEAATDSTVTIAWDAPDEGTPERYIVYFREVGMPSYASLRETGDTEFEHDPQGMTGWYRVSAVFGPDQYFAPETLTTVPVAVPEMTLAELHASGNEGYGWNRTTGLAATYSMREAANAELVDFYVTDFDSAYAGPTYSFASPTYGPADPSGEVPQAAWRLTGFTEPLPYEHGPLPAYDDQVYHGFRDIEPSATLGCYTDDGYYALLKVTSVNVTTGEVRFVSWFQSVSGLRLIRH